MPRTYLIAGALIGLSVGVISAMFVVFLALQDGGSQCEYYCEDLGPQYSALAGLGAITGGFLGGLAFAVTGLVPAAVVALLSLVSRQSSR